MATISTAGLTASAKLLNGVDSVAAFTYMAFGSGSTAEADSQTALVTELTGDGFARAAATCTVTGSTSKWELTVTNSGASTVTFREVGIFNAASNGTMLLRHVFDSDKSVGVGDSIVVTITDEHGV